MLIEDDLTVGHFSANKTGRDFIIGDLHGELAMFEYAVKRLSFDPQHDRIFSVGDLIDRGSNSKGSLQLLKESWFFAVTGNHEHMLLEHHADEKQRESFWFPSGGKWWKELTDKEQAEAVTLVREHMYLALTIEASGLSYGVIHADMPRETDWPTLLKNIKTDVCIQREALWSRLTLKQSLTRRVEGVDFVVCGHTPQQQTSTSGNIIHIDTGSGYQPNDYIPNPALTFLELGTELIYHRFDMSETGTA